MSHADSSSETSEFCWGGDSDASSVSSSSSCSSFDAATGEHIQQLPTTTGLLHRLYTIAEASEQLQDVLEAYAARVSQPIIGMAKLRNRIQREAGNARRCAAAIERAMHAVPARTTMTTDMDRDRFQCPMQDAALSHQQRHELEVACAKARLILQCSSLKTLELFVHCLLHTEDVVSLLTPFPLPRKHTHHHHDVGGGKDATGPADGATTTASGSPTVEIDIVAQGGRQWIKLRGAKFRTGSHHDTSEGVKFIQLIHNLCDAATLRYVPFESHPDVCVLFGGAPPPTALLAALPCPTKSGASGLEPVRLHTAVLKTTTPTTATTVSSSPGAATVPPRDHGTAAAASSSATDAIGWVLVTCPFTECAAIAVGGRTGETFAAKEDEEMITPKAFVERERKGGRDALPSPPGRVTVRRPPLFPARRLDSSLLCFDTTTLVAMCSESCYATRAVGQSRWSPEQRLERLAPYKVMWEQQRRELNGEEAVHGFIHPVLESSSTWTTLEAVEAEVRQRIAHLRQRTRMMQPLPQAKAGGDGFCCCRTADVGWLQALVSDGAATAAGDKTDPGHSFAAGASDSKWFSLCRDEAVARMDSPAHSRVRNWVIPDVSYEEFKWMIETIAGWNECRRALALLQQCVVVDTTVLYSEDEEDNTIVECAPDAPLAEKEREPPRPVSPVEGNVGRQSETTTTTTTRNLKEDVRTPNLICPHAAAVDSVPSCCCSPNSARWYKQQVCSVSLRNRIVFGLGDALHATTLTSNKQFCTKLAAHGVQLACALHPSRALTELKLQQQPRRDGPTVPPPLLYFLSPFVRMLPHSSSDEHNEVDHRSSGGSSSSGASASGIDSSSSSPGSSIDSDDEFSEDIRRCLQHPSGTDAFPSPTIVLHRLVDLTRRMAEAPPTLSRDAPEEMRAAAQRDHMLLCMRKYLWALRRICRVLLSYLGCTPYAQDQELLTSYVALFNQMQRAAVEDMGNAPRVTEIIVAVVQRVMHFPLTPLSLVEVSQKILESHRQVVTDATSTASRIGDGGGRDPGRRYSTASSYASSDAAQKDDDDKEEGKKKTLASRGVHEEPTPLGKGNPAEDDGAAAQKRRERRALEASWNPYVLPADTPYHIPSVNRSIDAAADAALLDAQAQGECPILFAIPPVLHPTLMTLIQSGAVPASLSLAGQCGVLHCVLNNPFPISDAYCASDCIMCDTCHHPDIYCGYRAVFLRNKAKKQTAQEEEAESRPTTTPTRTSSARAEWEADHHTGSIVEGRIGFDVCVACASFFYSRTLFHLERCLRPPYSSFQTKDAQVKVLLTQLRTSSSSSSSSPESVLRLRCAISPLGASPIAWEMGAPESYQHMTSTPRRDPSSSSSYLEPPQNWSTKMKVHPFFIEKEMVEMYGEKWKAEACPICLDPLAAAPCITSWCRHAYHVSCVEDMLLSSGAATRCPLCRTPNAFPPLTGPSALKQNVFEVTLTLSSHAAEEHASCMVFVGSLLREDYQNPTNIGAGTIIKVAADGTIVSDGEMEPNNPHAPKNYLKKKNNKQPTTNKDSKGFCVDSSFSLIFFFIFVGLLLLRERHCSVRRAANIILSLSLSLSLVRVAAVLVYRGEENTKQVCYRDRNGILALLMLPSSSSDWKWRSLRDHFGTRHTQSGYGGGDGEEEEEEKGFVCGTERGIRRASSTSHRRYNAGDAHATGTGVSLSLSPLTPERSQFVEPPGAVGGHTWTSPSVEADTPHKRNNTVRDQSTNTSGERAAATAADTSAIATGRHQKKTDEPHLVADLERHSFYGSAFASVAERRGSPACLLRRASEEFEEDEEDEPERSPPNAMMSSDGVAALLCNDENDDDVGETKCHLDRHSRSSSGGAASETLRGTQRDSEGRLLDPTGTMKARCRQREGEADPWREGQQRGPLPSTGAARSPCGGPREGKGIRSSSSDDDDGNDYPKMGAVRSLQRLGYVDALPRWRTAPQRTGAPADCSRRCMDDDGGADARINDVDGASSEGLVHDAAQKAEPIPSLDAVAKTTASSTASGISTRPTTSASAGIHIQGEALRAAPRMADEGRTAGREEIDTMGAGMMMRDVGHRVKEAAAMQRCQTRPWVEQPQRTVPPALAPFPRNGSTTTRQPRKPRREEQQSPAPHHDTTVVQGAARMPPAAVLPLRWSVERSANVLVSPDGSTCVADAAEAMESIQEFSPLHQPLRRGQGRRSLVVSDHTKTKSFFIQKKKKKQQQHNTHPSHPENNSSSDSTADDTNDSDKSLESEDDDDMPRPLLTIPMFARGAVGLLDGRAAFTIHVDDVGPRGSSFSTPPHLSLDWPSPARFGIGVALDAFDPVSLTGAVVLWSDGAVWAGGHRRHRKPSPPPQCRGSKMFVLSRPLPVPCCVTAYVDRPRGTIRFAVNGLHLGRGFKIPSSALVAVPLVVFQAEGIKASIMASDGF
eukprot:gene3743-2639_t